MSRPPSTSRGVSTATHIPKQTAQLGELRSARAFGGASARALCSPRARSFMASKNRTMTAQERANDQID